MRYWGSFQSASVPGSQSLTGEAFLSLGNSAVSGKSVIVEGGILALAEGTIRNPDALSLPGKMLSPAELVLRLYRRWGADYVRRVDGPAVTAVIDRVEGRLILSRDRAGAVPVYYTWRGRSVTFAGRAEYLLRTGAAGRTVDADGLNALFCPSAPPAPGRTPFRDIRVLEPGAMLLSDARGTRTRRYFSLAPLETKDSGEEIMRILTENVPSSDEEAAIDGEYFSFSDFYAQIPPERRLMPLSFPFRAEAAAEPVFIPDVLGDSLLSCGFPGDPAEDARAQLLCASASGFKTVVSAAGGACLLNPPQYVPRAPNAEAGVCRFLKPALRERLMPRQYTENRIRALIDRVPMRVDEEPEKRDERVNFYIAAAVLAPFSSIRWAHAASRAGLRACLPFLDERILARLWGMRSSERNALLSHVCVPPRASLTPFRKSICEEALRVAEDTLNPVHRYIDREAFEAEARKAEPDLDSLARLIQINEWFLQTGAEEDV